MKHWRLHDDDAPDQADGRYVYRVGWKFAVALAVASLMWIAIYFGLRWLGA